MAIKTKAELQAMFVHGAIPTQQNFYDLIDTIFNGTTSIRQKYLGNISQIHTDAPTIDFLIDNITGITLLYVAVGIYSINKVGLFAAAKQTSILIQNTEVANANLNTIQVVNDDQALIYVTNILTGTRLNAGLNNTTILIETNS